MYTQWRVYTVCICWMIYWLKKEVCLEYRGVDRKVLPEWI